MGCKWSLVRIQSSRPLKQKNCLYGGFFVLKDREAFDSKQRGSWATRRRGRRKYADEGKARTTTMRRCEHCEQDNPVIPTNHTAVTLNLIGTFFMSLFSYITKKPIIALQFMDFFLLHLLHNSFSFKEAVLINDVLPYYRSSYEMFTSF